MKLPTKISERWKMTKLKKLVTKERGRNNFPNYASQLQAAFVHVPKDFQNGYSPNCPEEPNGSCFMVQSTCPKRLEPNLEQKRG